MTALSVAQRALLATARTAVLATTRPDGRPRLVPICFVVFEAGDGLVLWSPLDAKPKATADVRSLARVRDVLARPPVSLLVHRWSEHWDELAWLRLDGVAALVEPGEAAHAAAADALVERYPQYATHDLRARPMLRIEVTALAGWSASA